VSGSPPNDASAQIAGSIAVAVTVAASTELKALRDRLALLVDGLDRFVTGTSGPTAYPYRALQTLRSEVTEAFRQANMLSQQLGSFAAAVSADSAAFTVDAKREVELGLSLVAPRLSAGVELLVDISDFPPIRAARGMLSLVVAELVVICHQSAQLQPDSAITVYMRSDAKRATLLIADNGMGFASLPRQVDTIAQALQIPIADVVAATQHYHGCVFELSFEIL
jgi:C4-dicarboxylate-specific signal transduction histidine kinase